MSQASQQHIAVKTVNGVAVAEFLNAPTVFEQRDVQEICEQLTALIGNEGYTKLLINLGDVQYLSSAMLGELILLGKRLAAAQGQLKLCCVSPALRGIFRVTKIERIFSIFASEQEALDAF